MVLTASLAAFCHPAAAEEMALAVTPAFVDLDGDGINDRLADNNDNGIPDRFERQAAAAPADKPSALGDAFNMLLPATGLDALLSKSEVFGARSFKTRSLTQRCHGFGAEEGFGPGSGIGLGAVSGAGGCAGGVCVP